MSDWITKDFWWKLFSLVLAVVIWLTVYKIREEPTGLTTATDKTLTYGNVPVLVMATASDVHNYRVQPGTVTVQVTGPAKVLSVLKENQIHPVVDLTGIATADNFYRRVEVTTPPGVTLLSVEPDEVRVQFPTESEKQK